MNVQKTPLYDAHVNLGAQMVDFGGWLMPVRYTSDKEEHFATRKAAGLFDVSHMGEVFLRGPKAVEAAETLLSNNVSRLNINQACYSMMLNERAGIVDDVIAYKLSPEEILICINAGNRDKDFAWMKQQIESKFDKDEVNLCNESDDWGQIALQGPNAHKIFSEVFNEKDWPDQKFYFTSPNSQMIVARTGYTGEDGVEIFCTRSTTADFWEQLLTAGRKHGLKPCGLSARDSLRLEAGLCLYGNDISGSTSPLEANLMWTVKLKKPHGFIGKEALQKEKVLGASRKLVGLKVTGRGIARHGYKVCDAEGEIIGEITSGTQSPSLNYPIAMAYVNSAALQKASIFVDVRGRQIPADIVDLPFYRQETL